MSADTSRPYRSTLRAEQAAATRRRVLLAVADEVTAVGYDRATLGRIAARADVSVETVKAQGAKRELLVRAFEVVFAGDEGEHSLGERVVADLDGLPDDPADLLPTVTAFVADAYARSVRLWEVFVVAARTDADVAAEHAALLARRRLDTRGVADLVATRTGAAAFDDATLDLVELVYSHESWRHLVEERGWSHEQWVRWAVEAVTAMLRPS